MIRLSTAFKRIPAFTTGKRSMSGWVSYPQRFWTWTTQSRPSWRESYIEAAVVFTVFGITGSSSVYFIRPVLSQLGLKGSLIEGPWSYRIGSILIISPVYASLLLAIGTISGRHRFFAEMSFRILRRFFPKPFLNKLKFRVLTFEHVFAFKLNIVVAFSNYLERLNNGIAFWISIAVVIHNIEDITAYLIILYAMVS
eukprot:gene10409-21712_t